MDEQLHYRKMLVSTNSLEREYTAIAHSYTLVTR
jgi:hypothetical protein